MMMIELKEVIISGAVYNKIIELLPDSELRDEMKMKSVICNFSSNITLIFEKPRTNKDILIKYIIENNDRALTKNEIAKDTGLKVTYVRKMVHILKEEGYLDMINFGRNYMYVKSDLDSNLKKMFIMQKLDKIKENILIKGNYTKKI